MSRRSSVAPPAPSPTGPSATPQPSADAGAQQIPAGDSAGSSAALEVSQGPSPGWRGPLRCARERRRSPRDLQRLAAESVPNWIDGGWCVDALLGKQTREHADLTKC
ncbi:nucleotidyltransferase domain-containing protein [Sinosporangium album]|uniref:nucleotidyltransferase domain-containing protein n=1 Tax=Sinosporangium album TaxID=504805 RepID=UPI001C4091E4